MSAPTLTVAYRDEGVFLVAGERALILPVDDAIGIAVDLRDAAATGAVQQGPRWAVDRHHDGAGLTLLISAEVGAPVFAVALDNAAALALADAIDRAVSDRDGLVQGIARLDELGDAPEPD